MFTGIIVGIATVVEKKIKKEGEVLVIDAGDLGKNVKIGSSVSIGGICLTAIKKEDSKIFFDVMPETLKKTTLGEKKEGDRLNIELTLKVGDEVGGHFVYGHVDGVGKVIEIENQGDNRLITIKPPKDLMKYIAPQGSIAIEGTSLTVASYDAETFTISLIPFTLKNTTLGKLNIGDSVNIESDMLLKHNFNIK